MKIGILKEGKIPPDYRVPFAPEQCAYIKQKFAIECVIQPSDIRCFTDTEYTQHGISLKQDLSDCDVIFGVKEVPVDTLIPNKCYLFFSHTIKAQSHNQHLMRALIAKNIAMIDYETVVAPNGQRVGAFGHEAGIVGAYNALRAYGIRYKKYDLPLAHTVDGKHTLFQLVQDLPPLSIRVMHTGRGGRVSSGVVKILELAGLQNIPAKHYIKGTDRGVFTTLTPSEYIKRTDGADIIEAEFFKNPTTGYTSNFHPYAQVSDMYISGHFWNNRSPVLFTIDDIKNIDTFPIHIISDISCDIPGPIPTTLRETSLMDTLYDINRQTGQEIPPFTDDTAITITAVDNLPSAIPRDASRAFGASLISELLPYLIGDDDGRIANGTLCKNGHLTPKYAYLKQYAGVKT